ncbi:DsbA family protein [Consotaella salsifontis]|uniref:Protein-disulfide isomerase n=1 Tax=Consotaella salsifontis TaxID=1365950 RepID=A0A1T4MVK7_9HYPH|nr:DsbA family protein [Consotaella salsifontis]SJZ71003.1 Protein-disulfide isomerase [Consotaella salsifontis]
MSPMPDCATDNRRTTVSAWTRHGALLLCGVAFAALPAAVGSAAADDAAGPLVAQAETAPANSSPTKSSVEAPKPQSHVDVEKLMAPQALPDIVLGKEDAPVTIVEYASLTCSHCADFHKETLPVVMKNYVDTGKVKFILREFPFDPRSLAAFMIARCAPDGRRTAMTDVLFDQQNTWATAQNASEALLQLAKLAGFTQESFKACLTDKDLQQKVMQVQKAGEAFGVNATPTFFVNGDMYPGAFPPDEMSAIIDAHL